MQVIDTEYTLLIDKEDKSLMWQVEKQLLLGDLRAHMISLTEINEFICNILSLWLWSNLKIPFSTFNFEVAGVWPH